MLADIRREVVVEERVNGQQDRGQGRTQLMAEDGQESVLGTIGPFGGRLRRAGLRGAAVDQGVELTTPCPGLGRPVAICQYDDTPTGQQRRESELIALIERRDDRQPEGSDAGPQSPLPCRS